MNALAHVDQRHEKPPTYFESSRRIDSHMSYPFKCERQGWQMASRPGAMHGNGAVLSS